MLEDDLLNEVYGLKYQTFTILLSRTKITCNPM